MWTRRPCGPRAHAGSAQIPRQTRGPPRHSRGSPLVLCLPPAPRGAAGTHCASTAPWGDLALLPLLVPEVWPTASPTSRGSLVCLGTLPAGPCAQAGDPPELVRVGDVSRVGLSPVMRTQRPRRVEEGGGRGDVAAGLRRGPATPRELGEASRRPPQPRREPLAHAWPRTCASTAVQGQISAAQAAECGTWPWQPPEARRLDECSLHVPVDAHAALDNLSSVETLRMVRKPAFEVPPYQQEQSLRSNFHSD